MIKESIQKLIDGSNLTYEEADGAMKEIFFHNLECAYGTDVSYVERTIYLTAKKSDIPKLRRVRSAILFRMSDEGMYDYGAISLIIWRLRWQNYSGAL